MSWRRVAPSAEAMHEVGARFAQVLEPGDVVLLSGPLGAGKTTFTQGVARGLGVAERVQSPTFIVVRQHRCANDRGIESLHHADVYRVGTLDEVLDLALGELVEERAVALVEWGELAASVFGRDVLTVTFSVDEHDQRTLEVGGALSDDRADALGEWSRQ